MRLTSDTDGCSYRQQALTCLLAVVAAAAAAANGGGGGGGNGGKPVARLGYKSTVCTKTYAVQTAVSYGESS
jgi:hypothetical protein